MSAWIVAGFVLSGLFGGKPTHLACSFQDADRAPTIEVIVAPSYRVVSLKIASTGTLENRQATLSGGMLNFDTPLQYGDVKYSINRADLSVIRAEGGPAVATVITKRQCKLQASPKPVF